LIKELTDNKIISIAKGEKIDTKRHNLKHDIKAVTFHGLKIEAKGETLATDIIFDV
jgi:SHS2 domain-containing protein